MSYVITFLTAYLLGALSLVLILYKEENKIAIDNKDKKLYCHDCQKNYLTSDYKGFLFCPYCGKELSFPIALPEEKFNPFNDF